ncbi:hypothetical protein chiPu_0011935 [Chiloscyllium punctatum]|uniref:Uncharacterized protein n=1 Tax=Chiloscyllium punctatum TaxID=137246 RepID=A0A401SSV8_CHIPU|nr:hypothetical protein [Chiloscyllium punctatum]
MARGSNSSIFKAELLFPEMIWEEKRSLMKMKAECKDMSVMRAVLGTMQLQVKEKNEEIARERVLKEETQDQKVQWMELKEKLIKKLKVSRFLE